MAHARTEEKHSEDYIVRDAIPEIVKACPGALVMRNEANAVTKFYQAVLFRIDEMVPAFARGAAKAAAKEAFDRISPMIKYGLGVGSADVIVCYRGRFIGLEFKSEDGRHKDKQRIWQAAVERAGGRYRVVRSVEEAVAAVSEP